MNIRTVASVIATLVVAANGRSRPKRTEMPIPIDILRPEDLESTVRVENDESTAHANENATSETPKPTIDTASTPTIATTEFSTLPSTVTMTQPTLPTAAATTAAFILTTELQTTAKTTATETDATTITKPCPCDLAVVKAAVSEALADQRPVPAYGSNCDTLCCTFCTAYYCPCACPRSCHVNPTFTSPALPPATTVTVTATTTPATVTTQPTTVTAGATIITAGGSTVNPLPPTGCTCWPPAQPAPPQQPPTQTCYLCPCRPSCVAVPSHLCPCAVDQSRALPCALSNGQSTDGGPLIPPALCGDRSEGCGWPETYPAGCTGWPTVPPTSALPPEVTLLPGTGQPRPGESITSQPGSSIASGAGAGRRLLTLPAVLATVVVAALAVLLM